MMAKKLVSAVVSRCTKKPTKRINKRRKLKSALKMISNYLKSDAYMFAPLIHPQSSLPPPPVSSGKVSFKSMEKKEKKLVEDVNDYLKSDSYMYAPLVMDSAYDGTARACDDQTEHDEVRDPVRRRRILVEHSLLQSERVKHILHQNCRSLSSTGEAVSQKKPGKVVPERAHTQVT